MTTYAEICAGDFEAVRQASKLEAHRNTCRECFVTLDGHCAEAKRILADIANPERGPDLNEARAK